MCAAINRVDVVGERVDNFVVAVVVLNRHFHAHRIISDAFLGEVDRLCVQDGLALVQMPDEFSDAAAIKEVMRFLRLAALIDDGDADAGIQKRFLAQALRQRVEVKFGCREDLCIRSERHLRATAARLAGLLQAALRHATNVFLFVGVAVAPDFDAQPLGQKVHHRHADAVQAAGYLVSIRVELAARIQLGQYHLCGRNFLLLVYVNRNAAPVVNDCDGVVEVNEHFDAVAVARERFVNRIIDNFVDQMMQSRLAGIANVHGGALAHVIASFKNGDRRCAIILYLCGHTLLLI